MIETDICIIGAGPAGMMAAIEAAKNAKNIVIFESNTTAGRKLLLTGRGRCNLTHTGNSDEIIRAFKPFDRFVRHCIYEFPPQKLCDFFSSRGLDTVAEEDGSIFPVTNSSTDVKRILLEEIEKLNTSVISIAGDEVAGVEKSIKKDFSTSLPAGGFGRNDDSSKAQIRIFYGKKVQSIQKQNNLFRIPTDRFSVYAKSLIIATGGVSWPQTGSTGDGYRFATEFGHKIIEQSAVVIPLITAEKFCSELAGIGIGDVSISCKINGKKISSSGAMIFTHSGIGGPAVFDLSREIASLHTGNLKILVDFLPRIKTDELDRTIADLISQNPKKNIVSILSQFLPKGLIQIICSQNQLSDMPAGQINKKSRKNVVESLKNFPFTIISAEAIEKATVTRGGVDITEIDSKTMQSKICAGLFFAGEVMNVDGPCGGYNLQFAFSSGFLAGKSAAKSLE